MLEDIRLFILRIVFKPQNKCYYLSRRSRASWCPSVVAINRLLQIPSFLLFCRYISGASEKVLCLCSVQDYGSLTLNEVWSRPRHHIAVLSLEDFNYVSKMLIITIWNFLYLMPPVHCPTGIYTLLAICCI